MGVDEVAFQLLQMAFSKKPNVDKALTLGRQCVHIYGPVLQSLNTNPAYNLTYYPLNEYVDPLLQLLGAKSVDSIDNSSYEHASIIHDMNMPLPAQHHNQYDLIFDGGTIEHIFNLPQVIENVVSALKVGGIFCSLTCNNNFSGHGFYQFSPEIFLRSFTEPYGMKLLNIFLTPTHAHKSEWTAIPLELTNDNNRQTTSLQTLEQTYICTIA